METEQFDQTVTTTCGYCGVGCRLEAHARRGGSPRSAPALDGPANEGHTCLKGRFAHQFTRSRDRLTSPLIREGDGLPRRQLGRGAAADRQRAAADQGRARPRRDRRPGLLARHQRGLLRDGAADARGDRHQQHRQLLAGLPLADVVRAAQVRSGSRARPARSPTSTTPRSRCCIGVNPTQGHPVVGARIKQAALRGCKLITIDPRRIELADYGVLHLSPRPGHQRRGGARPLPRGPPRRPGRRRASSRERTEGYEALEELLELYDPDGGRRRSPAIPAADLERAAHIYGEAGAASIAVGPRRDRAQVRLRGRAAALQPGDDDRQGRQARLGAAAAARPEQRPGLLRHGRAARHLHGLPLGRATSRSRARSRRPGASPLSREKGYTIPQMFDAAIAGDLKAMYIFGEDVAQTDPDTAHVIARAGERSSSWSARRSSRTRRPSTPTWSCRPPRSSRSRARSPTPSGASRLVEAGDRPARRRRGPTSTSS